MTGPSLQTHWLPSVVFSTQQRQAHTARHLVLKRNLTLHTSLLGKASHAHHHRLRSAGRNHIKLLVLRNRVVGNETYLASRAILSSDAYLSDLGKLIQFEQICSLACTQQEGNFSPEILDEFSEIEERSHTYATTYEQIFRLFPVGMVKPLPRGSIQLSTSPSLSCPS